jgi:cation:H+ antiporter
VYLIALLIGLLMLVGGAELLVRGGGRIALALRVPALVVGLTVVAFGTSTPELAVSVTAAYRASTEMALANVTGSNIANILLVLGLAGLVTPIHVDRALIYREVPICFGLQALVPLMCLDGVVSRLDGFILLMLGVGYNGWLVMDAWRRRAHMSDEAEELDGIEGDGADWRWHLVLLVSGLLVLLVGAQFFVGGAREIAMMLGMSDRTIGLTVIALGTSAPEVATAVVSAYRGQADLATGNSLGSNILNITMVLGITAMVMPVVIVDQGALLDLGVAVLVVGLLVPMVLRDRVLSRVEGGVMASGYLVYLAVLAS